MQVVAMLPGISRHHWGTEVDIDDLGKSKSCNHSRQQTICLAKGNALQLRVLPVL